MRYLSLFSGIEACTVAWHELGWEAAAYCEFDKFPSAVLAHHYPDVPNLGDVTQITDEDIKSLGHIDIVVGGSPCQDLSVAGKRGGLAGERSGLFHEQMRIFHAARSLCGSRWLLWENVPGAFSSHAGADFAQVVGAMAGSGCDIPSGHQWQNSGFDLGENGMVEWSVLDAQWFGVPQRRRRVFALLDTGDWTGRPPILLEPESLRGDPPPSREAGQRIAPCVTNGPPFSRTGNERVEAEAMVPEVANPLTARMYKGINTTADEGQTPIVEAIPIADQATRHAGKRGDQQDGKGNGLGVGQPGDPCPTITSGEKHAVAFQQNASGDVHTNDVAGTVGTSSNASGRNTQMVAFAQNQRDELRIVKIVGALSAQPGMKQQTFVMQGSMIGREDHNGPQGDGVNEDVSFTLNTTDRHAVAFSCKDYGADAGELSPTLRAMNGAAGNANGGGQAAIASQMTVRRLTPRECERLQGFPDDYTLIPWRGKPADQCPDGPRYKALGNSMAVPVMNWIGQRIQDAHDR